MSSKQANKVHPLPLSSTLHDLALLRASDIDFAALLSPSAPRDASNNTEAEDVTDIAVENSVQQSLAFSREARAALNLLHSDAVEREGARVDEVRGRLGDVIKGLDGSEH